MNELRSSRRIASWSQRAMPSDSCWSSRISLRRRSTRLVNACLARTSELRRSTTRCCESESKERSVVRAVSTSRLVCLSTVDVREHSNLRPIERRVLHLRETGVGVDEIGQRFRRSPEHIERMIELAQLPGRSAPRRESRLRPLERCILGWRAKGASHDEIAPRFGRSSGFVARVEGYAQHKLSTS